jgi:chloramphenicol-sensitive protein RarD
MLAAADEERRERRRGAMFAAAAYVSWGFIPLFFRPLAPIASTEVIAHRIVWCVLLLLGYRIANGGLKQLAPLLQPHIAGWLTLSSLCIALNWLIFVYAVGHNHVLQTSLGYYINPLLNVALGVLLLRERLRPLQGLAVAIASAAVLVLLVRFGEFPWVALSLAVSFGMYGLIRKQVPVAAIDGLLIETSILAPVAVAYLAYLIATGNCGFVACGWGLRAWLMLTGPVTMVPLLWFAMGARRLPLTTLGFLQYLAPSLSFLLAVLLLGEPFGRAQAVTFALIWSALAIYSIDMLRKARAA